MKLIVGLGNPGSKYEMTRHNLGFMVVDRLASEIGRKIKSREFYSLTLRVELEGQDVLLAKPQTYMNLSGGAVAHLAEKLGLTDPQDLIVIVDDLALPLGKIRIRRSGSAGGHNGLKSIIEMLMTDQFIRVRLGIKPEHPISDSADFVLSEFPQSEMEIVRQMIDAAANAVRTILRDGVEKAMAQYN